MPKRIIKTNKAPLPVGPYNQAVSIGNLVYTSGQIAIDPKTNEMIKGGVPEQTQLVLENLKAVLEGAGSSLEKIIKCTVFLKDMNSFADMNSVYKKYFDEKTAPARSTIEVARLPKDASVEIEAVATI